MQPKVLRGCGSPPPPRRKKRRGERPSDRAYLLSRCVMCGETGVHYLDSPSRTAHKVCGRCEWTLQEFETEEGR